MNAPPHESAHKHVTGEAVYTDDQPAGELEVWPVCSPHAHARILSREVTAARTMPGIHAALVPMRKMFDRIDSVCLNRKILIFIYNHFD